MANNFKFSLSIEAFTKGFDEINKNLKEFDDKAKKLSEGFTKLGTKLTVALTAPIALFASSSIKAFAESEKNLTKFTASFQKNGARIGLGFKNLTDQAEGFANNTLFDDDDILGEVTSQLLNFSTITGQVFTDAQKVILDFASKTGSDLGSATLLIGKALENPTEGLALLRRQTGLVTDAQLEMITKLDKAGKSAEAQAAIIKILQDNYGGFAQKLAGTDTGKLTQLNNAFKNLKEGFGQAFLQVFRPVIIALTELLQLFNQLSAPTKVFIATFATLVAAIGPALIVLGQLRVAMSALQLTFAALAGPAGLIALVALSFVALFEILTHKDEIFLKVNEAFLKMFPTNQQLLERNKEIKDSIARAKKEIEGELQGPAVPSNLIKSTVATRTKTLSQDEKNALKDRAKERAEFEKKAHEDALKAIRDEQAKSAPTFFEGSLNLPEGVDNAGGTVENLAGQFSGLTKEVRELTEAGQIVSNNFTTAFTNMATGAESASQAIKNLGRSLLQAFANAILQRAFNSLFAGIAGLGQTKTVPASTPSAPGLFGNAEGGLITGPGSGTSDSILSRLSNGEFVMKADAVKKWGVGFMHALNKGFMPAFAGGGMMSNMGNYLNNVPRFATGGIVNAQQPSVNVNVINNSSQPVTARSSQGVDVRGTVVNIILEDLKTNGPISQGNQQAFGLKR